MRWFLAVAVLLLVPAQLAAQPPPRVYVGAYLTDVSDFDLKAGRFKADLRVWVKWVGTDEVPNLTFENGEIDAKDELGRETEGDWHSVQWRVQGTFRGDFPVHSFPFDVQTLPVVFGLAESGGRLVPDLGASGMSPRFSVTGWLYEPFFDARTEQRTYGSDLGSIATEGKNTTLPRVALQVEMRRPIAPYLFKFTLPLALILLMALTALLLPPRLLEVRSAMGVTSLLTCIAFHYTQADTLPNVSYLVAADKLFLGAYTFVAATLVLSVFAYRSHEKQLERAMRFDRLGLVVLPLSALLLTVVLVVGALPGEKKEAPPPAKPRPTQPVLRIAAYAMDSLSGGLGPSRRSPVLMKGANGLWSPVNVEAAPSMTNPMVRLLPDGGMRVRWRLKDEAKWSDGSPITYADLEFSLNLNDNPLRTRIEKVDDRTADVTFSRRRQEWLDSFPLYRKTVFSPLYADGGRDAVMRGANEAKVPTTAPFSIQSFTANQALVLERNPYFNGPRPIFDKVEVVKMSAEEGVAALLAGKVDVLPSLEAQAYEALQKDDRVKVLEQPGELFYLLVPNVEKAPWNDVNARRALMQAIDRKALVAEFKPMPAQVTSGWRASYRGPSVPAFDPTALAKLGLAGRPFVLNTGTIRTKGGVLDRVVQRLAADLTRAGLKVEVVEQDELYQTLNRRQYDDVLLIARDAQDPSRFLNVPFTGGHAAVEAPRGDYFDAAMQQTWERFSTSLYEERRLALENTVQQLWVERLPALPLLLTSRVFAVRADLEGPQFGTADSLYWNVYDWKISAPAPSPPAAP